MLPLILSLFISSANAATSYVCDTKFDKLDIPRVETTSMEGFYYCFGLFHGRDRAWQMDYFRRLAQGRNAEVLGLDQLQSDLMMRLLSIPERAEKIWSSFPDESKTYLRAYADGVNKGFETGKNDREFKDLKFSPEPWKPQDSLSVLLMQAFDQTRKSFIKDLDEEDYKEKWGEKASELFDEDLLPWQTTILKEGEYVKKSPVKTVEGVIRKSVRLWAQFPSAFGLESGSNNWVVSSQKSKSRKALLANDPHLDLRTPIFWYWMGIKTQETKVIGGSVPGVPIFALGTNGKVSWGLTNSYLNAADAIALKDLKESDYESFRPIVKFKFWIFKLPFFFKSFERLKTGQPILPVETKIEHKIALRWTGFGLQAQDIVPMFELYKAQNVAEMDKRFASIGVPSWNFVFADTKGDIGFRVVGRTYKQPEKKELGIPLMTQEEFLNEQFLSDEEEPHLLKPKRNFIATANHRHWPPDSQFYGGRAYSYSFRALKIEELLRPTQTIESFKDIQCDREVMDARFFLPKIQKYLNVAKFANWDRSSEGTSTILPLYRRLFDLMLSRWEVNEYALFHLLDDLSEKQVEELKELFVLAEEDSEKKNWGEFHVVRFPHLSRNEDWVFSPEISGVGDTHTVDPGTSKWNGKRKLYEQNSGASLRMIIEMEEVPKIHLVLPGPNRNYQTKPSSSPWNDWKECRYTEIEF